tara:strand:+ start:2217 stop:3455 length:1239 start_codon:yes stop_codon:yes gene_type:complete
VKKILIVSYYWDQKNSVGRQRWYNLVNELIKEKVKVYVFTASNKNEVVEKGQLVIIRKRIFDINSFFSNLFSSKYSSGVIDSSESLLNKFFSWIRVNFFFPDSRIFWSLSSHSFLLNFIKERNINTVITSSPPHSMHLIGKKLKDSLNIKWISDFRDPYTNWDIFLNMKPSFFAKKIHQKIEKNFLNNSDKVLVTSSVLRDEYLKNIDKNKIIFLRNGSSLNSNRSITNEKFIISYFGLINKFRDPIIFLKTLDELLSENDKMSSKLELRLYGHIQDSTINYIENYLINKKNVKIFGNIGVEKVNEKIFESSILLLLLNNTKIQNTIPYKIYDYLVSEKQIITLGNYVNMDVDNLLKKYKRRNRVAYNDKDSIRNYISQSFRDFNNNNLKNISLDYSEIKFSKLKDILFEII